MTEPNFKKGKFAFPVPTNTVDHLEGLTKREWFAGMAMQGILSGNFESAENVKRMSVCAAIATGYADALLAELEKGE